MLRDNASEMSVKPAPSFLSSFRRKTSSGRFIPQIDGLRFIAISLVFIYHLSGYLLERSPQVYSPAAATTSIAQIASTGHYGVQLFFVLSGFVLALPFAAYWLAGASRISLRTYFLRRITRLEPPYIVIMVGFAILLVAIRGRTIAETLPHLAASLLYLHNIVYASPSIINTAAWTLEIEVQFYILAPLIAFLFSISDALWRRCAIVFSIALATGLTLSPMGGHPLVNKSVLGFAQFFLIGFLLADLYVTDWNQRPTAHRGWDLVSLVGWPLLIACWTYDFHAKIVFPILVFLLYVAAFKGYFTSKVLSLPIVTTIGGMCYTIYLIHYQTISWIAPRTMPFGATSVYGLHLLAQLAAVGMLVIVVSAFVFLALERPCMDKDWPRRLKLLLAKRGIMGRGEAFVAE